MTPGKKPMTARYAFLTNGRLDGLMLVAAKNRFINEAHIDRHCHHQNVAARLNNTDKQRDY
jgi:hypothetical protein